MGTGQPRLRAGAWDDAEIATLKQLHDQRLTMSQMAKRMNRSRNSIISKCHYLNLPARPARGHVEHFGPEKIAVLKQAFADNLGMDEIASRCGVTRARVRTQLSKLSLSMSARDQVRPRAAAMVFTKEHPAPTRDAEGALFTMLTIPSGGCCKWPHGDVGDDGFHLCGGGAAIGVPYCSHHLARAHAIRPAPGEGTAP
jgi:GcrA cell cycle regulator